MRPGVQQAGRRRENTGACCVANTAAPSRPSSGLVSAPFEARAAPMSRALVTGLLTTPTPRAMDPGVARIAEAAEAGARSVVGRHSLLLGGVYDSTFRMDSSSSWRGRGLSWRGRRLCDDSCTYISDGFCDDGGPGSEYGLCDVGTDCTDCTCQPPERCLATCPCAPSIWLLRSCPQSLAARRKRIWPLR